MSHFAHCSAFYGNSSCLHLSLMLCCAQHTPVCQPTHQCCLSRLTPSTHPKPWAQGRSPEPGLTGGRVLGLCGRHCGHAEHGLLGIWSNHRTYIAPKYTQHSYPRELWGPNQFFRTGFISALLLGRKLKEINYWPSLTEQIMLKIRKDFINLVMNIITIILFPCVIKQLSGFLCLATLWIVSCFLETCCLQNYAVLRLELKLCHWHELQDVFIINTENPVMLCACWIKGKIKGTLAVKTLVQSSQFILQRMTMCHWFLKWSRQLPSLPVWQLYSCAQWQI